MLARQKSDSWAQLDNLPGNQTFHVTGAIDDNSCEGEVNWEFWHDDIIVRATNFDVT